MTNRANRGALWVPTVILFVMADGPSFCDPCKNLPNNYSANLGKYVYPLYYYFQAIASAPPGHKCDFLEHDTVP